MNVKHILKYPKRSKDYMLVFDELVPFGYIDLDF